MTFETLKIKQDGGIMTVTLSNPPINLISDRMIGELFQLAGGLMQDRSTRVVVIDSEDPDFFIAHMDLNDIVAAENDPTKQSRYPDINALQSLGLVWQNLPQVKIAKIDGRCRGGGLEFILALDMRFASARSLFCAPEAAAGFVPVGGGTTRTALALGPARAIEMILSARDFTADEAERYGLINRSVAGDGLDAYVADLAGNIALRSPAVVGMYRSIVAKVFEPVVEPVFAALAAENDAFRQGIATEEMREMMRLHLETGQLRELELDLPATMAGLIAGRAG